MPTKTKPQTVTRRDDVRAAREARRDEIVERWQRRKVLRRYEHLAERIVAKLKVVLDERKEGFPGFDEQIESLTFSFFFYAEEGLHHDEMLRVLPSWLVWTFVERLAQIIRFKEMPYDEYLQTPHWKRIAARAKERFSGRCALDERHPAEHAHHRTYERLGREWIDDLIPLCGDCHSRFHDKPRRR